MNFGEAWSERVEGILFEVSVTFIGREAFIGNKRASERAAVRKISKTFARCTADVRAAKEIAASCRRDVHTG